MTVLTLTVPKTVDASVLEHEIITGLADRLRDDHGYELRSTNSGGDSGTQYPLHPGGSIVVDSQRGRLKVKLHGVDADAHDLFVAVTSELEQRHQGLRSEIG